MSGEIFRHKFSLPWTCFADGAPMTKIDIFKFHFFGMFVRNEYLTSLPPADEAPAARPSYSHFIDISLRFCFAVKNALQISKTSFLLF